MKKISLLLLCLFLPIVCFSQWEPCNNGLEGAVVNNISAQDDVMYICTNGGGISISTDFGESWLEKSKGLKNLNIYCVYKSDDLLLAGTNGGVFLSTDNGDNWLEKNTGLTNYQIKTIAAYNNQILIGTAGGGLFISADKSESWSKFSPTDTILAKSFIGFIIVKGDTILVGCEDYNGVYKTTDGGIKWKKSITGLLESNLLIRSMYVKDKDIFLGTNESLYKSTDNGKKWVWQDVAKSTFGIYSISGKDSTIIAANSSLIYSSTNNGKTWTKNRCTQSINSLLYYNNVTYAGTRGGVLQTTDFGASWSPKNNGLSSTYVQTISSSGNLLALGTYGNGVFISTNKGLDWIPKNQGFRNFISSSRIFKVLIKDNNTIFAGTDDGLYYSSDAGENWINRPEKDYYNMPISSIAVNNEYLFAGYFQGGVIRSSDNGATWESKINGLKMEISDLQFDNDILYATNINSGALFVSTDFGENWTQNKKDFTFGLRCLKIKDGKILTGGRGGKLFISSNKGNTWRDIIISPDFDLNVYLFAIESIGKYIFAGTSKGLYLSKDNGVTWSAENNGLKCNYINTLLIKGDTIYAGTRGGGIHFANLSSFGITDVKENVNSDSYLYTFPPFPNPATKETRSLVYWDTSTDIENDEIGIYNIFGAKVSDRSKISFEKLNLYSGYLIWNCSDMISGVYLIVIKHGTQTKTIKVSIN